MDKAVLFFNSNWAYIVPLGIALALFFFVRRVKSDRPKHIYRMSLAKMIEQEHMLRMGGYDLITEKDEATPSSVKKVLKRDDVTLRLLEEVFEPSRGARRMSWSSSPDSFRLHVLDSLESELRSFLREAIESDEFPQVRDRTIQLLDEIRNEKEQLKQKEPFNDILDPEKSLLIDVFHELDPGNTIVRQKAIQLSNIIKIKHQDLLKLQAENARAGSWTRWGVAGTIVFGVISLVLSFISIRSAGGGA